MTVSEDLRAGALGLEAIALGDADLGLEAAVLRDAIMNFRGDAALRDAVQDRRPKLGSAAPPRPQLGSAAQQS
eukprot:3781389-Alexandrium_andersonii.AAC.1